MSRLLFPDGVGQGGERDVVSVPAEDVEGAILDHEGTWEPSGLSMLVSFTSKLFRVRRSKIQNSPSVSVAKRSLLAAYLLSSPNPITNLFPKRTDETPHRSAPGMLPALSNVGPPSQDIIWMLLDGGYAPATRSFPLGSRIGVVAKPFSVGICVSSFLIVSVSPAASQYHTLSSSSKYSKARLSDT